MAYIGSTPAPQMPEVGTGAVETQDIQDGAVTAVKLAPGAAVPSQTGNLGKYLTTDGTTSSWGLAVASFNSRTGVITLSSGDVTGALGFTPYNSTNPSGYISSITSANVTTALGFTPYNATNPSGYTTNVGTVTSVAGTGTVSGLTLTGTVTTGGNLTLGGTLSVANSNTTATALNTASAIVARDASGNFTAGTITAALTGNVTGNVTGSAGTVTSIAGNTLTSLQVTTGLGFTPYNASNPNGYISGITSSNVTAALGFTPENAANKGVVNGYASLDASGLVPATQLPSYVDDVLEYSNLAAFPATGTTGKIFVTLDTNKTYRWSGSAYIEISASPGSTDSVTEGSTNFYFTNARARGALSASQNLTYNSSTGAFTGPDLSGYLTSSTATTTYQPKDADLTAIAGLAGTSGFLKKTAADTWALDTNTYLTGNQSISVTGDATGSGTTGIALTLAASGVTAGTYTKTTVDAKGRVTAGTTLASADLPTYTGTITSAQVTTALGFTPYNSTNPSGYTNNTGTVTSVAGTGTVSGLTLSGTVSTTGSLTLGGTLSLTSGQVTGALGFTPYNATNPSGYISGITSANVTTALGFTPYNATNPSGYITGITSGQVTTALGFTPYNATNPNGYITSSALSPYLTSSTASSTYLPLTGGTLSGAVLTQTAASSWGVYSKTSGYENHSGIWFSANVGELLLRNAAGGLVTRIAADGSYAFINNNNILHAGNYTSYSPALTGNYKNIGVGSLYSRYNYNEGAYINDSTSAYTLSPDFGSTTVAMHNSHGSFGSWATTLTMSGYERYGAYQISGDYNANPAALAIRNYNQVLGGWTPWVRMLSSANYTSYAMPAGASATNSVDIRAPLYYDSDNTAYYFNPNGVSNLNTTVTGSNAMYFASNRNTSSDSPPLQAFSNNGSGAIMSFHRGGYYAVNFGLDSDNVMRIGGWSAPSSLWQLDMSGNEYLAGSSRAPIFYDSNDTGYFVNPNSNSLLSSLAVNGDFRAVFVSSAGGSSYGSNHYSMGKDIANGSWSHPHYSDLIIGYHTGIRIGAHYSGTRFYSNSPTTDANNDGNGDGGESLLMTVGGYVGTANHTDVFVNNNLFAGASMRAPIYYDSNDTAYYVDPNSTSSMWNVNIRGDNNAAGTSNQIFFWGSGSSTTSAIGFKTNSAPFTNPTGAGDGYNTYLTMDTAGRGWVFREGAGGTNFAANYTSGWILNNGIWQANASMRAPIFYDSNNTAYYVDANSQSYLSTLRLNGGWNDGVESAQFNIRGSYPSMTFRSLTSNNVWLRHMDSTGDIQHYFATGTDSINWSVKHTMTIGGSFTSSSDHRAPTFYDSNNTAYYTDPASTSNLNTTIIAGHTYGSERASNALIKVGTAGGGGLILQGSDASFKFNLYGDSAQYGFLMSAWGAWDIKKLIDSDMTLRINSVDRTVIHTGNVATYAGGGAGAFVAFGTTG